MNKSELLFEKYLNKQKIPFSRNFPVNSHNVDFRLVKDKQEILCDVKEVKDSDVKGGTSGKKSKRGSINAQNHIRGDIKKLRQKFKSPPTTPLMLVSMNFSSNFFTALTVSRALMGEIGIIFKQGSSDIILDVHHLHSGNATLRQNTNTSISGLFLFDVECGNHYLFRSPYAAYSISSDFFSGIKVIDLQKNERQEAIKALSKITFWNPNL